MFRLLFVFYSIPLCECECAPMVLSPCYPVLYRSFARFHPWDFCDEPDFSFRVAIFNGILCIKFTIGALTTGNIYIGTTNVHFVWELQPICPQNVHRIEITNRKSARRNGINRRDYYTVKIRIFTFTNTSSKWNGARAQEKKLTHTRNVFFLLLRLISIPIQVVSVFLSISFNFWLLILFYQWAPQKYRRILRRRFVTINFIRFNKIIIYRHFSIFRDVKCSASYSLWPMPFEIYFYAAKNRRTGFFFSRLYHFSPNETNRSSYVSRHSIENCMAF